MDEATALDIIQKISQALICFQDHNMVHRDIKPANIIIDTYQVPKLFDFGLAKIMNTEMALTQPGALAGTPLYMSPEQMEAKNNVDIRSDIYSLGATFYYCLTGKSRFPAAATLPSIYNTILAKPKIKGLFSERVEKILKKMLDPQPDSRYESPQTLLVDLL